LAGNLTGRALSVQSSSLPRIFLFFFICLFIPSGKEPRLWFRAPGVTCERKREMKKMTKSVSGSADQSLERISRTLVLFILIIIFLLSWEPPSMRCSHRGNLCAPL
jgi:hypothetical protein